jgi:hypothetical protein
VDAPTIAAGKLLEIIGAKEVEIHVLRERVATLYQQIEGLRGKTAQDAQRKKRAKS